MAISLDEALAAATERYRGKRPLSAELADRAARVMPGGNTRSVLAIEPFAFRVAETDGAHLVDVDGHRYLDLLGDYSAGMLGHGGAVADTVRGVLDRGWSYGAMSEPEISFAEAVVGRFPAIDQVRFTNSGSEANLLALMTARHHTGRQRVVVFDGGYHGGPLYFGPGGEALRAPFDYLVLPYNDVETMRAAFAADGQSIAAVLVEPMMGAGGCIPGRDDFLHALREVATAAGAVLIFDEVMTSRLAVGGAHSLLGITPDLVTLGKYLAGGFSFGAFGGARSLMRAFDPAAGGGLAHGGTFNNNAFTMAAGGAVVEQLDAATLAALNERGDRLRATLNHEVFAGQAPPFTATGRGSFVGLHPVAGPIDRPADLDGADPRWRQLLFHELLDRGNYLAPRGYIALSLAITEDHVTQFVGAVGEALAVMADLVP
ncbi:MAG: aspartate aminotransferase family protein [Desertimonas sp.]